MTRNKIEISLSIPTMGVDVLDSDTSHGYVWSKREGEIFFRRLKIYLTEKQFLWRDGWPSFSRVHGTCLLATLNHHKRCL